LEYPYPNALNVGISAPSSLIKAFCTSFASKFNNFPSNFRSQKSLEEFFLEQGKFGIYDVDTRFLTKIFKPNPYKSFANEIKKT